MSESITIAIPSAVENMSLPDPSLLQYYTNAQERCFWIDFDIDGALLDVSREIINYNRQDKNILIEERKPIVIWIFTYGGDMYACYNFLDICALSKTPIITINAGKAMSAGLLMLLAGHIRYALPKSTALAHSGSAEFGGSYEQLESTMADYKRDVKKMREYIIERTKLDPKLFNRKKSSEWFLDANEQLRYGIVDAILDDIDMVI